MKRRRTKRVNRVKQSTITAEKVANAMQQAFSKALVELNTNRPFKHKQLGWVRTNSLFDILGGKPRFQKVKKPT